MKFLCTKIKVRDDMSLEEIFVQNVSNDLSKQQAATVSHCLK